MVELWLDALPVATHASVAMLPKNPPLLCLKSPSEKGSFTGSNLQRTLLLARLANMRSGTLVDIPLHFPETLFATFRKKSPRTRFIASSHTFTHTARPATLEKKLMVARARGAYVFKYAGLVRHPSDISSLLFLMQLCKKKKQPAIIIGMGPLGAALRLASRQLGLWGMFAPVSSKNSTASGQIPAGELSAAWQL